MTANTIFKVIFISVLVLLLQSCAKDNSEEEEVWDLTSEHYFVGKLDDEKIQIEEGIEWYINTRISIFKEKTGEKCDYFDGTIFLRGVSSLGSVQVLFYKNFEEYPTCDQITNMYELGEHDYAKISSGVLYDGVIINYTDDNNIKWSTATEQASQDGSSFTLEKFIDHKGTKLMEAKFNCTLFNEKGEAKKLSSGIVRGICVNDC